MAYSCRTNVFITFDIFNEKKKKKKTDTAKG